MRGLKKFRPVVACRKALLVRRVLLLVTAGFTSACGAGGAANAPLRPNQEAHAIVQQSAAPDHNPVREQVLAPREEDPRITLRVLASENLRAACEQGREEALAHVRHLDLSAADNAAVMERCAALRGTRARGERAADGRYFEALQQCATLDVRASGRAAARVLDLLTTAAEERVFLSLCEMNMRLSRAREFERAQRACGQIMAGVIVAKCQFQYPVTHRDAIECDDVCSRKAGE